MQAISRHPGYDLMKTRHLGLLRQSVSVLQQGEKSAAARPASSFSPTLPLSQRFFDFRFLNNWGEVQAVVDRLGPELSPIHLEAAYNRIKFLRVRPSPTFLDELANRAVLLAPGMSARNIASVLHACGRLQYFNPNMMNVLAKAMLDLQLVKGLDTLEMTSLVFGFGLLHHPKGLQEGSNSGTGKDSLSHPVLDGIQQEFWKVRVLDEQRASHHYVQ